MAAIEVSVDATAPGGFRGRKSALTSYQVDEAITPLDSSLGSPGVGTVSFGAVESPNTVLLMDNGIELRDGSRGLVKGTVRAIGVGDMALRVTSDSILILLNATKSAAPYNGTLGGYISYLLGLCGITGGFQVEAALASRSIIVGGVNEVVLNLLSELCVAQQIEMTVVYDNIVFRTARKNVGVTRRSKSASFSIDRGSPAKTVESYYYNYSNMVNGIVYPSPLENLREGFQVDPSQSLQPTRVQLAASLTSVNQPVAMDFLGPDYSGTGGAYVVIGSDGLPIPPAEWGNKGGLVSVEIDPDDSTVLIINITGMNEPDDPRSPYTVGAMSSGDGVKYPAFYITGSGVGYDKQKVSVSTGATNTEIEVGVVVDNRMISTLEQALTGLQKAAYRYSGLNYSVSGDTVSINRAGTGQEFATSKLQVFDDMFSGQKLSALDAMNWKFDDFDEYFASLVADNFENQLFGNAGGARIFRNDAWFRVDSATTTESSVAYSATMDTLWADYDSTWSGQKLAAWDTAWSGHKLRDWDIKPLAKVM